MKKYLLAMFLLAPLWAHADVIAIYSDQGDFVTDTGATSLTGAIPNSGNVGPNPTLGDVTFDTSEYATTTDVFFGLGTGDPDDLSTLIPGNDIALSGSENMDIFINLGMAVEAFGFFFHEPSNINQLVDGTNTGFFHDSVFTISFFNGSDFIDSVVFDPANDQLLFFGVVSNMAFNNVSIVESLAGANLGNGGADYNNDNEFFGEFYAANSVSVPEPTTIALLGLGLAGLGLRRRRN